VAVHKTSEQRSVHAPAISGRWPNSNRIGGSREDLLFMFVDADEGIAD